MDAAGRTSWWRRPGWIVGGVAAVALLALAVAHTTLALSRSHETTSDWASIEMRTRDVFSRNPPLIGAWSRYEWSHPGPLLFYLLAVPYRLGGQTWQALWVGALLLNMVALGLAVWLAARRSVGLAAAVLLAGLATVAAFRSHLLTDVWNATVVVLPVITVVVAVVGVRAGDRAALPVLVLAGMFVAQSHFGFGVVLAPLALTALPSAWRRWRRPTLVWLAIGFALWLPVLVDTVVHWPGNFLTSVGWNLTADEPARGAGESLRVLGRASSLSFVADPGVPSFDVVIDRPAWGTLPFLAVVALLAAWMLARRRAWVVERLAADSLLVLWLTGLVAVARIKGPLLRWIVDWTYPLVALTWAVVGLVAYRLVAARWRVPSWARIGAVAGASIVLVVANVAGSIGEPYINAQWVPILRQFHDAARADPRLQGEPILIDVDGELRLTGALQSGLVNLLEKDGVGARVRQDQELQFGAHRAGTDRADRLVVRSEATAVPPAGGEAISTWDPLSPLERAEADALTTRLAALLRANGLDDQVPVLDTEVADLAAYGAPPAVTDHIDEFRRLAELRRRGPRVVLYHSPT